MTVFKNDAALLEHFRNGDQRGLLAVYNHYYDEVTQYIADQVPETEAHRKLIYDTFYQAFSRHARLAYDSDQDYRSYILNIAKERIVNYGRNQNHEAHSISEEVREGR